MTLNLLHGMNGMKTNIKKLDLEYQYTMLAHHVKTFLDEASHFEEDGIYRAVDDDLEPMRKRLKVINELLKEDDTEVC